jgi:hypothetical protein
MIKIQVTKKKQFFKIILGFGYFGPKSTKSFDVKSGKTNGKTKICSVTPQ